MEKRKCEECNHEHEKEEKCSCGCEK